MEEASRRRGALRIFHLPEPSLLRKTEFAGARKTADVRVAFLLAWR
jgi:hypothetical protein